MNDRNVQVQVVKRAKTCSKQRIIEITKIDGSTTFVRLPEDNIIRDALRAINMPEELIAYVSTEINGKIVPFTTKLGDLDVPCVRIRAFPLRGGARTDLKEDILQTSDQEASV